jgi:hypothetical protein
VVFFPSGLFFIAFSTHLPPTAPSFSRFFCPQCWEEKNPARDPTTHELRGDAKRFPDGMAALGAYVHAKNLSFAMYTAESPTTCGGFPASANYEDLDAKTFAKCEWNTMILNPFPCRSSFRTLPFSTAPLFTISICISFFFLSF